MFSAQSAHSVIVQQQAVTSTSAQASRRCAFDSTVPVDTTDSSDVLGYEYQSETHHRHALQALYITAAVAIVRRNNASPTPRSRNTQHIGNTKTSRENTGRTHMACRYGPVACPFTLLISIVPALEPMIAAKHVGRPLRILDTRHNTSEVQPKGKTGAKTTRTTRFPTSQHTTTTYRPQNKQRTLHSKVAEKEG